MQATAAPVESVLSAREPAATTSLPLELSTVNAEYYACFQQSMNRITEEWPDIAMMDPLPQISTEAGAMTGFIAPFSPAVYDARRSDANFEYACGINFFWQNMTFSVLNYVPIYLSRVMEYSQSITPGLLKNQLILVASFATASSMPRGHITRLSAEETSHAIVFKVATVLNNSPTAEVKKEWLRTLLSAPGVFKRLDNDDDIYAETNSLRQDIAGTARAVEHTARQLCYNVYGFKLKKEQIVKDKVKVVFSAKDIAEFWSKSIRVAQGHEYMKKKSTIDACLTVMDRILKFPEIEKLIVESEEQYAADCWCNSLWKLQEIIYRCGTKDRIHWTISFINDRIASDRLDNKSVTIGSIKTGSKSVADVALACRSMKTYLLGPWLEGRHFPGYVKSKAREIFANHVSYRTLWAPIDGKYTDTTWLFSWPEVGSSLLKLLDSAIYNSNGHEEALYRTAIKNNNTPEEIFTWSPWKEAVTQLQQDLLNTAILKPIAGSESGVNATVPRDAEPVTDDADVEANVQPDPIELTLKKSTPNMSRSAFKACKLLKTQRTHFIVEPSSGNNLNVDALASALAATPLATVSASADSGQVLILMDTNTYGETDHQPQVRVCPVAPKRIQDLARSVLKARCGSDTPDALKLGDLWCLINGGKDRKRAFTKPLSVVAKSGRDKDRTFTRTIQVILDEQSVRDRRKRTQGHVKVTQQMYMSARYSTFIGIPSADYASFKNMSTRADVIGPVRLDPLEKLPQMTPAEKKVYLGQRLVLAGGKIDDVMSDDDDDDEEMTMAPLEKESQVPDKQQLQPLSWHCLPCSVVLNVVKGFHVKHVIDLMPTPLGLAYELMNIGCSYVAVCGTQRQVDFLEQQLMGQIVKGLMDPNSGLYDRRLVPTPPAASPTPAGGAGWLVPLCLMRLICCARSNSL